MRGLLWVEQAEAIIDAIGDIPGVRMPIVRKGCTHVYYTIPFLIVLQDSAANGDVQIIGKARDDFCGSLESDGVPVAQGYVPRCIGVRGVWAILPDGGTVSIMVNFSILKTVNGPLTKQR